MKNTVCLLLEFCPPAINPEFVMECTLTLQDQWDCVLNDLEELGGKQLFLNHQCSTAISFLLLLLLPSMLSIDRQTNE